MTFALPQDFTAISPDGIAILKGAPNLEFARHFMDFVLGEEGQKLWFLPRGHPEGPQKYSIERMSVRPDFYRRYREVSNIEFSPFELKQNFIYNARLSRERREVVAALAGALLVDTLPELQHAWRVLVRRGLTDAVYPDTIPTPADRRIRGRTHHSWPLEGRGCSEPEEDRVANLGAAEIPEIARAGRGHE